MPIINDLQLLHPASAPPLLSEFQKQCTLEFVRQNADLSITKDNFRDVYKKLTENEDDSFANQAEKPSMEQQNSKNSIKEDANEHSVNSAHSKSSSNASPESLNPSQMMSKRLSLPPMSQFTDSDFVNILRTPFAQSTPLNRNTSSRNTEMPLVRKDKPDFSNGHHDLIKQITELQDMLDKARDQARKKSRTVDILEGKVNELTHQLNMADSKYNESKVANNSQNNQIKTLKAQNLNIHKNFQKIQSELIQTNSGLYSTKKELSALQVRYATLLRKFTDQTKKIEELSLAASRSSENENTIRRLALENHELKNSNNQLNNHIDDLTREKHLIALSNNPKGDEFLSPSNLDEMVYSKEVGLSFTQPSVCISIPAVGMRESEELRELEFKCKQQKKTIEECKHISQSLQSSLTAESSRNKELVAGFLMLSEEIGIQKWIIQSLSKMSPTLNDFCRRYDSSMPTYEESSHECTVLSSFSDDETGLMATNTTMNNSSKDFMASQDTVNADNPHFLATKGQPLLLLSVMKSNILRLFYVLFLFACFYGLDYILCAELLQAFLRVVFTFCEHIIILLYGRYELVQPS